MNCARNCILYGNPAAYSRTLSGLISRTIKLEGPLVHYGDL